MKWMTLNKLKLNKNKTELIVILLSLSIQTHKCSISSLTIGGCDIEVSSSIRNL